MQAYKQVCMHACMPAQNYTRSTRAVNRRVAGLSRPNSVSGALSRASKRSRPRVSEVCRQGQPQTDTRARDANASAKSVASVRSPGIRGFLKRNSPLGRPALVLQGGALEGGQRFRPPAQLSERGPGCTGPSRPVRAARGAPAGARALRDEMGGRAARIDDLRCVCQLRAQAAAQPCDGQAAHSGPKSARQALAAR